MGVGGLGVVSGPSSGLGGTGFHGRGAGQIAGGAGAGLGASGLPPSSVGIGGAHGGFGPGGAGGIRHSKTLSTYSYSVTSAVDCPQ